MVAPTWYVHMDEEEKELLELSLVQNKNSENLVNILCNENGLEVEEAKYYIEWWRRQNPPTPTFEEPSIVMNVKKILL